MYSLNYCSDKYKKKVLAEQAVCEAALTALYMYGHVDRNFKTTVEKNKALDAVTASPTSVMVRFGDSTKVVAAIALYVHLYCKLMKHG